jgi:hypothetical protein
MIDDKCKKCSLKEPKYVQERTQYCRMFVKKPWAIHCHGSCSFFTNTDQVEQALEDLEDLCQFSYEQGFHELGYNPLQVIKEALGK